MPLRILFFLFIHKAKIITTFKPFTCYQPGGILIHKQIGLPAFVYISDEMANKRHVVRPHRPAHQRHLRFIRRSITLAVVARNARGDQILPGILSSMRLRHNVIDRERHIAPTTVLTPMVVTTENVLTGKDDLFEGKTNENRKAHHARERHGH